MKLLSVFCLLLSLTITLHPARAESVLMGDLKASVNNMIGTDVDASKLLGKLTSKGNFDDTCYPKSPKELASICYDLGFALPSIGPIPAIGWSIKVCPLERVGPLQFSSKGKISTLTTRHTVGSTYASAQTTAFVAKRNERDNCIEVAQANYISNANVLQQTTASKVRTCRQTFWFFQKCEENTVINDRGLYYQELDTIGKKLERESLLALKQKLNLGSALNSLSSLNGDSLSGYSIYDVNGLKTLFPVILHDITEVSDISPSDLSDFIKSASMNLIKEYSVISQIVNHVGNKSKSSYFVAPTSTDMFSMYFSKSGSTFTIKFVTYKIEGKLPSGAQASSTGGSWSVRNTGIASSPSLDSILRQVPASA